jgi:hypothetical protein
MRIGFSIKYLDEYYNWILPFIKSAPKGYKFTLFHLDKLYNNNPIKGEVKVELVDLTNKYFIKRELQRSKISAMVFFTPGQIFDVFLTSICKEMNIKTIYFQHGLSLDFNAFDSSLLNRDKSLKKKFASLKRFMFFFFYFIINLNSVNKKRILIDSLFRKMSELLFSNKGGPKPKYGLVTNHCDIALVYGKTDKNYLVQKNGFSEEQVFIGSYPFLREEPKLKLNKGTKKIVFYISSALRLSGVIPISEIQEYEFYEELISSVNETGCHLVIKLHPIENYDKFKINLKINKNVTIYKDENLANLTSLADVVIGDYSTALLYPIKYKKPLLLLQSPYFERYPFDYSEYGIGKKVYLEDLSKTLNLCLEKRKIDNDSYEKFLRNYLGDTSTNPHELFFKLLENKL